MQNDGWNMKITNVISAEWQAFDGRQKPKNQVNSVLDAALVSLKSRFCSNIALRTPSFEKDITQLCKVAKLDAAACAVQGEILLDKTEYKSPNAAIQHTMLKMINLKHHWPFTV
jgi:hypothetical protein